jgi:hypothetical protein
VCAASHASPVCVCVHASTCIGVHEYLSCTCGFLHVTAKCERACVRA